MAFSRNLKVTMLEHDIAWGDKQANLAQLERYMRNMPDDTDLVVHVVGVAQRGVRDVQHGLRDRRP